MQPDITPADLERLGRKWGDRIRQAEKREESWINDAEAAEKAYLADDHSEGHGKVPDFNILHSNVETIVPSLYNSTPVPDIRERHKVGRETPESAIARAVSQILERGIATQIDDSRFDPVMEAVAQDAFVAGRGILRLRYDAKMAEPIEDNAPPSITDEWVEYEAVSWRDYREGPASGWKGVPWVSFKITVPEEEAERIADPKLRQMLAKGRGGDEPTLAQSEDSDVCIWEIWDKHTRKVLFLVDHSNEVIKIEDDPLGLPEYFPMVEPVQPIGSAGRRKPVVPYKVYKSLAEELDRVTVRIRKITEGLKVRGIAAAGNNTIEQLATLEDNQLASASDIEGLAQTGLEKAVLFWPIERSIEVLRELYAAREQIKQAIYEITGISDIIRGQGKATETATAQQIKTEWGSLRIKKLQNLIKRTVRDTFVMTAEIMTRHFQPQTLQMLSGIQITPEMMGLLNSPLDHYRIDVETDSTVRADATRERDEMGRFLEGTGQFFNTMGPLVAEKPEVGPVAAELYAAFARKFDLGKQAEDAIEAMAEMARQQPPEQQGDPAAQAQAQAEMGKLQLEQQKVQAQDMADQRKTILERQKMEADVQIKRVELLLKDKDLALKDKEVRIKELELALKDKEITQRGAVDMAKIEQADRQAERQENVSSLS